MKKLFFATYRWLILLLFLLLSSPLIGKAQEGKVQMHFRADSTFKVVQFTDVHYEPQKPESAASLATMRTVLEAEKPDLIIYTGDIVTGVPINEAIEKVFAIPEEMGIPFAYTFGNHDDEWDMDREAIYHKLKEYKHNITTRTEGISGITNYVIEFYHQDPQVPQALLYVIDSHAYSKIESISGYDWIKSDQVAWYERESKRYKELNGGKPIPALAYFHIPIPEYNYAAKDERCRMYGHRGEAACTPAINTGIGAAMIQAGDVMATFVGHDHVNDYLVSYQGLVLGYGRFTGDATTYNDIPHGSGARVVQLKAGDRHFKTWIRLADGSVIQPYDTSASYHK